MDSLGDARRVADVDEATARAMAAVAFVLGVPAVVGAFVLWSAVVVMEVGLVQSEATGMAAVATILGTCLLGLCSLLYFSVLR